MKQQRESVFHKALLALAGTAVGVGAFLGIPVMKAWAASQELKVAPLRAIQPPPGRLNLTHPAFVNPSATKLVAIADQALSDAALMDRILREPDAVAAEHNLSDHERMVLTHMNAQQFETARSDAARVSASRLGHPGAARLPASATDARLIAGRMVVGRAILAAAGRSYLEAANANACCPWSKAIELGVNPSRSFYDEVFKAPANLQNVRPRAIEAPATQERG